MPDGYLNWWGATIGPPAKPPVQMWPSRTRPEFIVDCWGVMLADPAGNIIGFNSNWGGGRPPAKMITATRTSTAGDL